MKERASVVDPVRLLDGAGDDDEIALLRAACSTPPAAARERAISLFDGGAGAESVVRSGARALGSRSPWSWIGWSFFGLALVVAGGLVVHQQPGSEAESSARPVDPVVLPPTPPAEPPPRVVREPDPTPLVSVTALPSVASSSPGPSPTPRITRGVGTEPSRREPAATREGSGANLLAEEVAALDTARRALRAGDTPGARSALDAYDRRFPSGVLAPEGTLLRVEVLLSAGDDAEARRLGEQFLAHNANGAYVGRMRALLQKEEHPAQQR